MQVQRGEAEIGEQAGSLGSKALTAGALLADKDAVLGTVKSMVHIPVVHRPHRRIGGLIHDDVLHDLAGGDLGLARRLNRTALAGHGGQHAGLGR